MDDLIRITVVVSFRVGMKQGDETVRVNSFFPAVKHRERPSTIRKQFDIDHFAGPAFDVQLLAIKRQLLGVRLDRSDTDQNQEKEGGKDGEVLPSTGVRTERMSVCSHLLFFAVNSTNGVGNVRRTETVSFVQVIRIPGFGVSVVQSYPFDGNGMNVGHFLGDS